MIYTTNAIEALNRQLRKAIKTKDSFPTADPARKLIYLAIGNAVPQWTRTRLEKAILAFKIHFGDRLPDQQQETAYTEKRTPSEARDQRYSLRAEAAGCGKHSLQALDGDRRNPLLLGCAVKKLAVLLFVNLSNGS